jgi:hypothetical protein
MRTYLRGLACLVSAGALAGGMLAAGSAAAAAVAGHKVTICTGTPTSPGVLTGTYRTNVVVKGACEVNAGAAVLKRDLTLSPGSVVLAAFALNDKTGKGKSSLSVRGDLRVGAGATLVMGCNPQNFACLDDPHPNKPTLSSHDTVGRDLISVRPLGIVVHNSSIGGDVLQTGGGGGRNCKPSGVFKLFKSPVYSTYEVGSVGGDVRITGVKSCWMGLVTLQVRGDMVMRNNKLADPDAIEILANHIRHDLTCRGNSRTWDSEDIGQHLFPRKPEPNKVGGDRAGQCVLSSPTKPGGPSGPGPF